MHNITLHSNVEFVHEKWHSKSMIKYKVVGIISLLNGILFVLSPILMYLFVIPKFIALYEESTLSTKANLGQTYLSLTIVFILGIINIFLGSKLLFGAEETKKKYYKYGLAMVILFLVLWGLYFFSAIFSGIFVIQQISNLYR